MSRIRQLAISCIILLIPVAAFAQTKDLVIGSFNIEWLGHGNNPRTDAQIQRLADYIKSLEVDVLACQEINPTGDKSGNGIKDWKDLLDALGPDYNGWYGNTGGGQRLAFIWNETRVTVSDVGELKGFERQSVPGTSTKTFPRIPLTAYVKSKAEDGADVRIITVHLYWGSDKARYQEAKALRAWLYNYLQSEHDTDVLLLGDCNTKSMGASDDGDSETMANIEEGSLFTSISKDHNEFTTPTSKERYDHAFLSQGLLGGEYRKLSWDVHREVVDTYPDEYRRDISNHVPVTLHIADKDDDNEASGDYGDEGE